jgi:ABC-type nitrate/sulfonate/bicarbonate transport system substrate-binding protein
MSVWFKLVGADIVPAIQQKRVAAGMLSFPTSLQAEKLGLKTLYDLSESDIEVPTTTVAVSRAYANAHPDLVSRFFAPILKGHTIDDGPVNGNLGVEKIRRHSR